LVVSVYGFLNEKNGQKSNIFNENDFGIDKGWDVRLEEA
jgi:hypothetical protein